MRVCITGLSIAIIAVALYAGLSTANMPAKASPPAAVASWHPPNWDTTLPDGVSPVRADGRRIVPNIDPNAPDYCPGESDPSVTQADLNSPEFIQDSRNVSAKTKKLIYKRDGVPYPPTKNQPDEIDHDVSICLSGAETSDPSKPGFGHNLWCEPRYGPWNAYDKDKLESKLHRLNKAGKLSIAEAVDEIRAWHWVWSYRHYFGTPDDAK